MDRLRFLLTVDGFEEVKELGGRVAAQLQTRLEHVANLGWRESLQLEVVKHLAAIDADIYEIPIRGTGAAYRAFCFATNDDQGQLVVVTSCVPKRMLMPGSRLRRHVERAARRRAKWIEENQG